MLGVFVLDNGCFGGYFYWNDVFVVMFFGDGLFVFGWLFVEMMIVWYDSKIFIFFRIVSKCKIIVGDY